VSLAVVFELDMFSSSLEKSQSASAERNRSAA